MFLLTIGKQNILTNAYEYVVGLFILLNNLYFLYLDNVQVINNGFVDSPTKRTVLKIRGILLSNKYISIPIVKE